ncbi:MAG: hypothetical protein ACLTOX_02425 [Streptococcus thermophilus]
MEAKHKGTQMISLTWNSNGEGFSVYQGWCLLNVGSEEDYFIHGAANKG